MTNYDTLVEDFPEYLENQKVDKILFGLFYKGNHIVIRGSKNAWKSKSAASSGLREIIIKYLYENNIINYRYSSSKEVDTVKKMLLEKGIIEIKEIK
jgi:hypothetical protein